MELEYKRDTVRGTQQEGKRNGEGVGGEGDEVYDKHTHTETP
jgi:hypothetical protein